LPTATRPRPPSPTLKQTTVAPCFAPLPPSFAYNERILLMADEVYQELTYRSVLWSQGGVWRRAGGGRCLGRGRFSANRGGRRTRAVLRPLPPLNTRRARPPARCPGAIGRLCRSERWAVAGTRPGWAGFWGGLALGRASLGPLAGFGKGAGPSLLPTTGVGALTVRSKRMHTPINMQSPPLLNTLAASHKPHPN
jgi:hypothetical protein